MPRRWPSVTISIAGTSPSTVPAESTTVPLRNGMRAPRNVSRPPVWVMKHTSWLSGFAAVRRPSAVARSRTCGLGEVPDREHRPSQFALRQHVHDVALVLGRVRTAMHEVAVADCLDTGVVAGGDRVEPEQVGALAEPIELEVPVALDARIRRQALAVGADVRDRRRAC